MEVLPGFELVSEVWNLILYSHHHFARDKQRGSGAPPLLERKKSQKKCAVDPLDDTTLPLVIAPHHRANALGRPPESFIRAPIRTEGEKEIRKEEEKDLAKEAKEKEVGRAQPNEWSHASQNNHRSPLMVTPQHALACLLSLAVLIPLAQTIMACQGFNPQLTAPIFVNEFTAPTFF